MNFLHLTYYIILKYYNKGEDAKTYSPLGTTIIIYTMVFAGQLFALTIAGIYLQNPYSNFETNNYYGWMIIITSACLAYLLFARHDKTLLICHHYNNKPWADAIFLKIAVRLYVVLSIISPFLVIIARNAAIGKHLI